MNEESSILSNRKLEIRDCAVLLQYGLKIFDCDVYV